MYSRKGKFTYKLIVFVTTSEDQCVEIENAGEKKVLNKCCNSFLSSSLVIVENSVTLIWMHPKFFYNYFFTFSNKFLQTPTFFLRTLTNFFYKLQYILQVSYFFTNSIESTLLSIKKNSHTNNVIVLKYQV